MTDTLEKEPVATKEHESPLGKIMDVINARGLTVSGERVDALIVKARLSLDKKERGEETGSFTQDGLMIYSPIEHIEGSGVKFSKIDFMPRTKRHGGGATIPQRGEGTRIMLEGIRAFQDYAILVEAGFLEQPDTLYGRTNPVMSKVATKRLGFHEGRWDMPGAILTSYPELRDRLFSPEIAQMEAQLVGFQERHTAAAEVAGPVAVGSSI